MASTYIYRNNDATAGSGYTPTWTWSAWVKRGTLGEQGLFMNRRIDHVSNSRMRFYFSSADRLAMEVKDSTSGDDSFFQTNRLFRDVNAWYHIVLAYDTTESAENDRIKLWINNEEVDSWEQFNRAGSTFEMLFSSATRSMLGIMTNNSNADFMFDGSMSHVHFIYGTAYTPSAFGETDATTGEWKIKTSPSVTYGTQGFFVLKDGNSATDQSGQSNNMTIDGGTLTKTEDCPSNVFATLNPLSSGTDFVFSNGNNTIINSTSNWNSVLGTLAFGTGKYYFEAQRISANGTANIGITLSSKFGGNHSGVDTGRIMYSSNGNVYKDAWSGLSNNTSGGTFGSGDIIGVSLDTENGILKFYKNGALVDTTTNSLLLSSNNEFIPALACYQSAHWRVNFGNGYFADNAVSSAGTNASGNGIFEYDIQPTDATALSTKGLNL